MGHHRIDCHACPNLEINHIPVVVLIILSFTLDLLSKSTDVVIEFPPIIVSIHIILLKHQKT